MSLEWILSPMLPPEAIEALDLRRAGASIRQVADTLSVKPHIVRRWIKQALEEIYSPRERAIDQLRGLEAARLDGYLVNLANGIKGGDTFAISAAIKIADRRAKMWGLDAPTNLKIEGDLKINVAKPDDLAGGDNSD